MPLTLQHLRAWSNKWPAQAMDIRLHMCEVKGPVMDGLRRTHFCEELTGQVFLSTYDAWKTLCLS